MILHGKDLIISANGIVIAGAKSCDVEVECDTIPTSSPTDGQWEHKIVGRKSWKVSTSHLVPFETEPSHVTSSTPLPSQSLIFIENIEFTRYVDSEPYASYREKPASASDVIDPSGSLDGNPAISSSVTMPVSMYRNNDRLLGTQVRSTRLTTYPYLFTPRKELKARFRITSAMPWPYALMVTHLNKRW